jgi:hypothetical protein
MAGSRARAFEHRGGPDPEPGRRFSVPVLDGYAHYRIAAIAKGQVDVELEADSRLQAPVLAAGGRFALARIADYIAQDFSRRGLGF